MSEPIFHLALLRDWEAALEAGSYEVSSLGRTLAEEGFIHASRADQWRGVQERYYGGVVEPLVLLVIDPDSLTAPLRVEPVGDDTFPHLYGPLNLDAVVRVEPVTE